MADLTFPNALAEHGGRKRLGRIKNDKMSHKRRYSLPNSGALPTSTNAEMRYYGNVVTFLFRGPSDSGKQYKCPGTVFAWIAGRQSGFSVKVNTWFWERDRILGLPSPDTVARLGIALAQPSLFALRFSACFSTDIL
ncbi:hypothetical protein MHM97_08820 [Epibacterium sp. Ofav1-8]|nr:hypothetical protein [Epibacterium sp. Ofav1-8]